MSGLLFRRRYFQFPLGQIKLREARIEEVDGSRDSDEDLKACGRGLQPAPFTIAVYPQEQGPTYLLVESRHEKVSTDRNHRREAKMASPEHVCALQASWLYHLSVAVGTTVGQFGTEFEQLVGKLYQMDGDPSESLLLRT